MQSRSHSLKDLMLEEVGALIKPKPNHTGYILFQRFRLFKSGRNLHLPNAVDWTRFAGPIEDQGNARTCCIIATLSSIESLLRIQYRVDVRLSRRYLDDVLSSSGLGSSARIAMMMIRQYGVPLESDIQGPRLYIQNFARLPCYTYDENEEPMPLGDRRYEEHYSRGEFQNRVAIQPIVVELDSSSWSQGVSEIDEVHRSSSKMIRFDHEINHTALVVGYGTHTYEMHEEKYWLVKNTWGYNFGRLGYTKIARDTNEFGIEQFGYYPTVDGSHVKEWIEKVY